jgi:hypothetical protein
MIMKRLLFYSTLIGLALIAGCKEEKKVVPTPEKPRVVQDSTAGYFSFKNEQWIYQGDNFDGSEESDFSDDTLTKIGDTLITYDGEKVMFKKIHVKSRLYDNYRNFDGIMEESYLYFCYREPNMIRAEKISSGYLIFDEYTVMISEMNSPLDPNRVIDTISFNGKKFLSALIKTQPNNPLKFNFIFGINLNKPGIYPVYHKEIKDLSLLRTKYIADGQSIDIPR